MSDQAWLEHALMLANRAADHDEVPVGAVLVYQGKLIGEGWNCPISQCDPTAHAEIQAMRQGAQMIGNYRLLETTLYVTLEPCLMCLGAMIHARIGRLVFGADDAKAGAVHSIISLQDEITLNHYIPWQGGIIAEECADVLTQFFKRKRNCAY